MTSIQVERQRRKPKLALSSSALRRYLLDRVAIPYLFLIPGLVIYSWFTIVPVINTLLLSLYKWDGILPAEPVGLKNFVDLFTKDKVFLGSFANSLVFVIYYTIIPIGLAFLLSVLMTRRRIRGLPGRKYVYAWRHEGEAGRLAK